MCRQKYNSSQPNSLPDYRIWRINLIVLSTTKELPIDQNKLYLVSSFFQIQTTAWCMLTCYIHAMQNLKTGKYMDFILVFVIFIFVSWVHLWCLKILRLTKIALKLLQKNNGIYFTLLPRTIKNILSRQCLLRWIYGELE